MSFVQKIKFHHLVLFSLVVAFIVLSIYLLLIAPLVWPDESLHADIALNILKENRTGTYLWEGLVKSVTEIGFGYPPLYFYYVAAWFKVFGFSIEIIRISSVFLSAITIIILYFYTNFLFRNLNLDKNKIYPWFSLLACGMLIIDYTFFRSAKMGRPEAFVLPLGLAAVFLFQKSFQEKQKKQVLFLSFSGLLLSIAFLSHLTALIFFPAIFLTWIFQLKFRVFKSWQFYVFLTALILPIAIWLWSIHPYLKDFIENAVLQKEKKDMILGWLKTVFLMQPISLRLAFLGYLLISWEFITYTFINRNLRLLTLNLLLISSWFLTTIWKHEFSFMYLPPLTYTALVILFSKRIELLRSKAAFTRNIISLGILALTAIIIFTSNLLLLFTNFHYARMFSYHNFAQEVIASIPPDKTVYLVSIPDPYFDLKARGEFKMYEFPMIGSPKEGYLSVLSNSDYIVYNQPLEWGITQDLLPTYIIMNMKSSRQVGHTFPYQAEIIELKPKNERVNP